MDLTFTVGMMVSRVAMKLITTSVKSLMSLEDRHQFGRTTALLLSFVYTPAAVNGSMVRLAKQGKRGSIEASFEWRIAVVQQWFFLPWHHVLMEVRHNFL